MIADFWGSAVDPARLVRGRLEIGQGAGPRPGFTLRLLSHQQRIRLVRPGRTSKMVDRAFELLPVPASSFLSWQMSTPGSTSRQGHEEPHYRRDEDQGDVLRLGMTWATRSAVSSAGRQRQLWSLARPLTSDA